ncbi:hypothetical protein KOXY103107_17325 [Komagataeibacter xylinus]
MINGGLKRPVTKESTMSGSRILWGQVSVVLLMIIISWWMATQWVAWKLGFLPQLGPPRITLAHHWPVYCKHPTRTTGMRQAACV